MLTYVILRIKHIIAGMAFRDINPQGPVHFLVIPKDKKGLNKISSATEDHKPLLGILNLLQDQCQMI